MSPDQIQFKQFIETNAPALGALFDWKTREVISSRVDHYLNYASSGEEIIARFLVGVWLGNNRYGFDLLSAAKRLDEKNLNIIQKWLNNPIWP